jgi:hypothetical protein
MNDMRRCPNEQIWTAKSLLLPVEPSALAARDRKGARSIPGEGDEGLADIMAHLVGVPVYKQFVWEFDGKRHLARTSV